MPSVFCFIPVSKPVKCLKKDFVLDSCSDKITFISFIFESSKEVTTGMSSAPSDIVLFKTGDPRWFNAAFSLTCLLFKTNLTTCAFLINSALAVGVMLDIKPANLSSSKINLP